MATNARAVRRCAIFLTGLVYALAFGVAMCGQVLADTGPQIATATTQDLLVPASRLSVVWHRKRVSALPFRIRLLDQASPLAYSLDINRPVAYGDSWTGISLGRPAHEEDRSLSNIGIADPLIAEAIARGDSSSGKPVKPATSNLELAARQVAIWAATNDLRLTPRVVPDGGLRRRAKKLFAGVKSVKDVPLQAASHSVQIFVQDTTANTVQLAVTIGLDANLRSATAQNIDLYLDGVRCPIRTNALTHIERRSDGTYHAGRPKAYAPNTHSNDVAEVDLDRNTKVVDATADWVNVISDPGLVMAGANAAPPLVTAESATLNFTSTTRLDPSDYTNPEQLLNNAGTAFLTTLHGWVVWAVLLIALYLLPRAGRLVDAGLSTARRLAWRKPKKKPQAVVTPATVEVEAATESEAIQAGLLALNLRTTNEVIIKVLQASKHPLLGSDLPARVRLTRRPGRAS